MPTVLGTDHRGREVSTLDLTIQDRLALVRQVIDVHRQSENRRAGKERSEYVEKALEAIKVAHAPDADKTAYLFKVISADIPLRQETYPEEFTWRQRGGFPTTLEGLEQSYLAQIATEKGDTDV